MNVNTKPICVTIWKHPQNLCHSPILMKISSFIQNIKFTSHKYPKKSK